ncbi:MAG: hypothetical protein HZC03_01960 [Candidatus Lloydbacteria bacterium]|nr:hypothetical protein [Candidatus Lloydbacteria bacterium]
MDTETQKLFQQNLLLSEENNKILKRLQSNMRWGRFIHAVYWVIIIGSAFGAYYFAQPYIDQLMQMYGKLQGLGGSISPNILDTLKSF